MDGGLTDSLIPSMPRRRTAQNRESNKAHHRLGLSILALDPRQQLYRSHVRIVQLEGVPEFIGKPANL